LTGWLLDTNIVSLLGPTLRADPEAAIVAWLDRNTADLYLPVISVAELTAGIAKLRRLGSTRRAAALAEWLDALAVAFHRQILPLDIAAAAAAGRLTDRASAIGRTPGFADLAIAGIAEARGLTILTRNLRHFAPLGVPARDPYDSLPG
jgi:hypothetical protein